MERAFCLPRVELWENLALQFYMDSGRSARSPVRAHGPPGGAAHAAAAAAAAGGAAKTLLSPVVASSAHPIVALMLPDKGAPVCSAHRSAVRARTQAQRVRLRVGG